VEASDESWHDADEKLEGGPSVLFDAIAILPSAEGAETLAVLPAAKDFLNDAMAHRKFIAYTATAEPLLTKAGVAAEDMDDGFVLLKSVADCKSFVAKCRQLRFWARKNAER
jgi:catalase